MSLIFFLTFAFLFCQLAAPNLSKSLDKLLIREGRTQRENRASMNTSADTTLVRGLNSPLILIIIHLSQGASAVAISPLLILYSDLSPYFWGNSQI